MSRKPARIESPEILKQLRAQWMKFDQACRKALAACDSDVMAMNRWLAADQRLFLKMQLRKRDEAVVAAEREYSQARWNASDLSRSSGVEEKRALERAKQAKQDVERRLAAVERWTVRLDDEVGKLRKPCISLSNLLDGSTPKALASIDGMLDSLEEYLRPQPPEGP